jgi:hypothetical protein
MLGSFAVLETDPARQTHSSGISDTAATKMSCTKYIIRCNPARYLLTIPPENGFLLLSGAY